MEKLRQIKAKFGFDKTEWAMWLAMVIGITFAAFAMLFLSGCANAFTDLHDGQGMRGWAGIPLKDSMPVGAAMMQAGAQMQQAQAEQNMANAINANARANIISSMQHPAYPNPTPGTVNIYIPPTRVPTWSNPNGY
jgi:hypothetical protein